MPSFIPLCSIACYVCFGFGTHLFADQITFRIAECDRAFIALANTVYEKRDKVALFEEKNRPRLSGEIKTADLTAFRDSRVAYEQFLNEAKAEKEIPIPVSDDEIMARLGKQHEALQNHIVQLRKGDIVLFRERTESVTYIDGISRDLSDQGFMRSSNNIEGYVEEQRTEREVDDFVLASFMKSGAVETSRETTLLKNKDGSVRTKVKVNLRLPERRFKLGAFLGAGNTAHVFRLADDPSKVIRLPYLSDPMRLGWGVFMDRGTLGWVVEHPSRTNPNATVRTQIHDYGLGYVITDYVDGTKTSAEFVSGLEKRIELQDVNPTEVVKRLRTDGLNEEALMFERLMEAAIRDGIAEKRDGQFNFKPKFRNTRWHSLQYLWEENRSDWGYVDGG